MARKLDTPTWELPLHEQKRLVGVLQRRDDIASIEEYELQARMEINKERTNVKYLVNLGENSIAKQFIKAVESSDINYQTLGGWGPLHWAAMKGFDDIVNFILQRGGYVDLCSENGWTPLHMACLSCKVDSFSITTRLLEHGALVDRQNEHGFTPLYIAADMIVKLLVEKGGDVNILDSYGWTPIHCAVRNGNKEMVEYFRAKGLDLFQPTQRNLTAFHLACEGGNLEMLKYVNDEIPELESDVESVFDLSDLDRSRPSSPKLTASKLREMSSQGSPGPAYASRIGSEAPSAPDLVVDAPQPEDIEGAAEAPPTKVSGLQRFKLAAMRVASSTSKSSSNSNPFLARLTSHLTTSRKSMLSQLMSNIDARSSAVGKSSTPNSFKRHMEEEDNEFSNDAGEDKTEYSIYDLNYPTNGKWTCLHFACAGNYVNVASWLIEQECDIDPRDVCERTPLHVAAHYGHIDVVRLLIEKGAKEYAIDCDKKMPFELASTEKVREALHQAILTAFNPIEWCKNPMLYNEDSEITEDRIKQFKFAFNVFDVNGSGLVDSEEIAVAMKAAGQNPNEEELERFLLENDTDGSGEIDFEEFLAMIIKKRNATTDIRDALKLIDKSGEGVFESVELPQVMNNLQLDFDPWEIDELIMEGSARADGRFTVDDLAKKYGEKYRVLHEKKLADAAKLGTPAWKLLAGI